MLSLAILLLRAASYTLAGDILFGGNCSAANNRIDPSSRILKTDCDVQTYCTPNGRCGTRRCRRDQWPYGYALGESLPPMCPNGLFCPDEGSGCMPLIAVGQQCQLDRDGMSHLRFAQIRSSWRYTITDECAPPPSSSNLPTNSSICLQSRCQ